MRKVILSIIFLFIMIFGYTFAQNTDYRGCVWGDSLKKVIQIEGTDFTKVTDIDYAYFRQLGDNNSTYIHYLFKDDELRAIEWIFTEISIFNKLTAGLVDKYGEPSYFSYGLQRWKNQRTIIELSLIDRNIFNKTYTLISLKYSSAKDIINNGL